MTDACTCPRCGYDQSGVIKTWESECALQGVCSECGLEFCWGDLLNPRLNTPRWSFEHTNRRYARAFLGTFVRACAIRPLWGALNIANPVERRRLVVFAVLMIALTHITAGGVNAWHASRMDEYARYLLSQQFPGGGRPTRLDTDLASRVFTRPFRAVTYTPSPTGKWSGGTVHRTRTPAYTWLMLAPVAAFPLAFLVLWQTRRHAQIKPEHAMRIGIYSMAVLPAVMIAWSFRDAGRGAIVRWNGIVDLVESGWILVPVGVFVWLALFWLAAIRRYLQLREWLTVWIATTTVAGVASACILALYIAA